MGLLVIPVLFFLPCCHIKQTSAFCLHEKPSVLSVLWFLFMVLYDSNWFHFCPPFFHSWCNCWLVDNWEDLKLVITLPWPKKVSFIDLVYGYTGSQYLFKHWTYPGINTHVHVLGTRSQYNRPLIVYMFVLLKVYLYRGSVHINVTGYLAEYW